MSMFVSIDVWTLVDVKNLVLSMGTGEVKLVLAFAREGKARVTWQRRTCLLTRLASLSDAVHVNFPPLTVANDSSQGESADFQIVSEQFGSHLYQTCKMSSSVSMDLSKSALLELPPELRNEIWRMVLHGADSIAISATRKLGHEPSLLRVSSQIRREAQDIYLLENTFELSGPPDALPRLLPETLRKIRGKYHVFWDPMSWPGVFEFLRRVHSREREYDVFINGGDRTEEGEKDARYALFGAMYSIVLNMPESPWHELMFALKGLSRMHEGRWGKFIS